jgi:hypothetical protein
VSLPPRRTYLLERSRVVAINNPERNYHIFYQICDGASKEQAARWYLQAATQFRYLNQSTCYELPGVNNAEEFQVRYRWRSSSSSSSSMLQLDACCGMPRCSWRPTDPAAAVAHMHALAAVVRMASLQPVLSAAAHDLHNQRVTALLP